MISSIRKWMFQKSIKEHQNFKKSPNRKGVNLCINICIVANGSDPSSKSATDKYKSKLEAHKKNVEVLYFIDNKKDSDIGYSRQSIKWNGIPEHEIIDNILSKEFDLLIFLNPTMEDHLRYLVILCNAKFKIGPKFEEHNHIFDLILDLTDISNTETLIQNVDEQLRLLSK